jgi:hypothetical protein
MSDPEGPIPAAAQLWDEMLQGREEQRQFRQDFEDHRVRVKERHAALGQQLALVVQASEHNTEAREDYEIEIKQLHTVMRQWYHAMVDLQKLVLTLTEQLDPDRIVTLDPPLALKSRERAA